MNRPLKDAPVQRLHDEDHAQLRQHLADFVSAYNVGRRLRTLRGLPPYELIGECWTSEPDRFILDSIHPMPGLNTGIRLLFEVASPEILDFMAKPGMYWAE